MLASLKSMGPVGGLPDDPLCEKVKHCMDQAALASLSASMSAKGGAVGLSGWAFTKAKMECDRHKNKHKSFQKYPLCPIFVVGSKRLDDPT